MNQEKLFDRIEQCGLRPSDVKDMSQGLFSINEASSMLHAQKRKKVLSKAALVMLGFMCEKMGSRVMKREEDQERAPKKEPEPAGQGGVVRVGEKMRLPLDGYLKKGGVVYFTYGGVVYSMAPTSSRVVRFDHDGATVIVSGDFTKNMGPVGFDEEL